MKPTESLDVTCHDHIGIHPFHRINTCYIKQLNRPLEINEKLTFLQSFSSADKIKTLDITTNVDPSIDHIPTEAFVKFAHLESLRVRSKVIAIVASDLELAKNLRELVVSNQLQIIQRGIFPVNNKLSSLSFESNRISKIEDFAYENLNHLFALKLLKNQLEEIRQHTFQGLAELVVLNLNQNKIRSIQRGSFECLFQLKYLRLEQNQLSLLSDDTFRGLGNLLDISIGRNLIQIINNSLKSLGNIKMIDLSENQISDLDLNEFVQFKNLENLRLSNSGFSFNKTIQNHNEQNAKISKLEYLYLDGNNLSDPLDLQALDIFSELTELSLEDNSYREFDLKRIELTRILPKLQKISLEGNEIDQRLVDAINAITN